MNRNSPSLTYYLWRFSDVQMIDALSEKWMGSVRPGTHPIYLLAFLALTTVTGVLTPLSSVHFSAVPVAPTPVPFTVPSRASIGPNGAPPAASQSAWKSGPGWTLLICRRRPWRSSTNSSA